MAQDDTNSSAADRGVLTMKDVAQAAGVGVGTVSRVVNGATGVSLRTKTKVEAAILKLGFNPNPIAQSMRSGLTKMLACVVRDFSVPILSSFANALQTAVDGQGFGIQVVSSYHDPQREIETLKRLANRRADGVVIASSSETNPAILAALDSCPIPVVLLDRDLPETLDAVLIDHRAGMRAAVRFLLGLGHRRIALLTGQPDVRPVRERLQGYNLAFADFDLTPQEDMLRLHSFDPAFSYSETMQLLSGANRPTAVIAGGTAMLPGVLRAIMDHGLKIPRDISVISGADSELALLHSPSIAVVRWQHDQLGATAARFLLNRLGKKKQPRQRMVFPSEFIPRESCGAVPD